MIGAENKNIHITVFRGGSLNHGESVQEGKDIFSHLKKHNITFSDVYVDEEGNAIKDGVRADMHHTFSNSDGYIDTTGHNNLEHNKLAKKMGLQKLFSEDMSASLSLDRLRRVRPKAVCWRVLTASYRVQRPSLGAGTYLLSKYRRRLGV